MDNNKSKNKVLVLRITVDEKLANDLIRLMISPLADNVEKFSDASQY
ncbi:hypothetical protein ACFL7M_09560 [Thermodesulfobacteriota bacterium]